MKLKPTSLVLTAIATITTSACSGSSGPFAGKSSEEVAMYIVSGFEKDTSMKEHDFEMKVVETQAKPLMLTVIGSGQGMTKEMGNFTVTDEGNCTFSYSVVDKLPQPMFGTWKVRINMSGLTAAKLQQQHGPVPRVTMDGAKIECVAGPTGLCGDITEWGLYRFGPFDGDEDKEGFRELRQKRVNEAVQHLKENVCKG